MPKNVGKVAIFHGGGFDSGLTHEEVANLNIADVDGKTKYLSLPFRIKEALTNYHIESLSIHNSWAQMGAQIVTDASILIASLNVPTKAQMSGKQVLDLSSKITTDLKYVTSNFSSAYGSSNPITRNFRILSENASKEEVLSIHTNIGSKRSNAGFIDVGQIAENLGKPITYISKALSENEESLYLAVLHGKINSHDIDERVRSNTADNPQFRVSSTNKLIVGSTDITDRIPGAQVFRTWLRATQSAIKYQTEK